MAFYALLAKSPKSERWRTCAIFPAGGTNQAAAHAKMLRDSNSLGFVPHPSQFRMRVATRREMSLLARYMASINNSTLPTFRADDLEGLFHRRRKLMTSFFMGLFLQPEVMKRHYGGGFGGGSSVSIPGTSTSGTGGVESEMEGADHQAETDQSEGNTDISDAGVENAAEASSDAQVADDDAPLTDSSSQDAVLAALEGDLAAAEEEIKVDTTAEIDLDFI
jgi:hypothetical protein